MVKINGIKASAQDVFKLLENVHKKKDKIKRFRNYNGVIIIETV